MNCRYYNTCTWMTLIADPAAAAAAAAAEAVAAAAAAAAAAASDRGHPFYSMDSGSMDSRCQGTELLIRMQGRREFPAKK